MHRDEPVAVSALQTDIQLVEFSKIFVRLIQKGNVFILVLQLLIFAGFISHESGVEPEASASISSEEQGRFNAIYKLMWNHKFIVYILYVLNI